MEKEKTNEVPCILILQENFMQIFDILKTEYGGDNIKLISSPNGKWIYTNPEYYLEIIKNSEKILGKQDKCYNISFIEDNGQLASGLGKVSLCYFQCPSDKVATEINKDLAVSLSHTTFNRFGQEKVKPIPTYIGKKGISYQIQTNASEIEDYNMASKIVGDILSKNKDYLQYYSPMISIDEKTKQNSSGKTK